MFSIKAAGALMAVMLPLSSHAATEGECVPEPVIDMHLHFYTQERFWGPAPDPSTGQLGSKTAEEHTARTLEAMKDNQVVLALASAGPDWQAPDDERLLRSLEAYDPDAVDIAALEKAVDEGRFKALGEIAPEYFGIAPNDPRWEPVYALAEEHELPVGIHTGGGPPGIVFRGRPKFRYEYGNPYLLQDVLVGHPDMKVYMMHAGLSPYAREALAMMHMYPDLHAGIGVANWVMPFMQRALEEFLVEAVSRGYGDRILFGTDQMVWPSAIPRAIDYIKKADFLSEDQKRDILFENAARFLGLSEEERAELIERACP